MHHLLTLAFSAVALLTSYVDRPSPPTINAETIVVQKEINPNTGEFRVDSILISTPMIGDEQASLEDVAIEVVDAKIRDLTSGKSFGVIAGKPFRTSKTHFATILKLFSTVSFANAKVSGTIKLRVSAISRYAGFASDPKSVEFNVEF